jgi:FkbM family methyltransferase
VKDDKFYSPNADFSTMCFQVFAGLPGHVNSEKFLLAVAGRFIEKGDVVVDAGANHGQHSRVFGKLVGTEGEVHCVEADPTLSSNLFKAVKNSPYQILVYNLALSNGEVKRINFYSHATRDQEGSLFLREDIDSYTENTVEASSLDSLDIRNVKFVKIDVEGAEFDVLKGAKKTIRVDKPLISIEISRFGKSDLNYSPSQFLELLDEMGCNLYNLVGDLIILEDWMNYDFFMNHMNWIVVKGSSAEIFLKATVNGLAEAFCWGATDQVPYPFKLIDHPIS